jgi:hypothetical protein
MTHHGVPAASQQPSYYDHSGSMALSGSLASLGAMSHSGSGHQLSKTDSHAVLMELFARDQDLVRQATETASFKPAGGKGAGQAHQGQSVQGQPQQIGQPTLHGGQAQRVPSQHPMKNPSQNRISAVPTLNSWPHFSSVSSLNNLGTMPGVKSITSLSGVDLASQGPVNRIGNLAQVKSVESMGKNDSYAFLEVFFGDRSSTALSIGGARDQRGIKRERDEDNDVGLSLEDESPAASNLKQDPSSADASATDFAISNPFMSSKENDSTGTLKRAYDDALAARGLISVSRSCERLTDLALPAKMQRTLSQEYLRQQQMPPGQSQQSQQYGQFQYTSAPSDQSSSNQSSSQQYPGQHPGQQQFQQSGDEKREYFSSEPNDTNASVEVPSATKCALCQQTGVDTQLRPCGHMFHERCLKPSLQAPMGPPKCPIDHIAMQSALLAVPTDEVCFL